MVLQMMFFGVSLFVEIQKKEPSYMEEFDYLNSKLLGNKKEKMITIKKIGIYL